jgi:hypothetical protein
MRPLEALLQAGSRARWTRVAACLEAQEIRGWQQQQQHSGRTAVGWKQGEMQRPGDHEMVNSRGR